MYTDYLASRGYRRITVERTNPAPGDLVLSRGAVERVPEAPTVVPIRRRVGVK